MDQCLRTFRLRAMKHFEYAASVRWRCYPHYLSIHSHHVIEALGCSSSETTIYKRCFAWSTGLFWLWTDHLWLLLGTRTFNETTTTKSFWNISTMQRVWRRWHPHYLPMQLHHVIEAQVLRCNSSETTRY